jgi:hypothetical protein
VPSTGAAGLCKDEQEPSNEADDDADQVDGVGGLREPPHAYHCNNNLQKGMRKSMYQDIARGILNEQRPSSLTSYSTFTS